LHGESSGRPAAARGLFQQQPPSFQGAPDGHQPPLLLLSYCARLALFRTARYRHPRSVIRCIANRPLTLGGGRLAVCGNPSGPMRLPLAAAVSRLLGLRPGGVQDSAQPRGLALAISRQRLLQRLKPRGDVGLGDAGDLGLELLGQRL